MSRSCKRSIKDHDLFGHHVSLQFNQNGSHHQTFLGGCLSIMLYLLALSVFCLRLPDVFTIISSVNSSYLIAKPDTAFDNISLKNQGINMFLVIEDIEDGQPLQSLGENILVKEAPKYVEYDDQFRRKASVRFVQRSFDPETQEEITFVSDA